MIIYHVIVATSPDQSAHIVDQPTEIRSEFVTGIFKRHFQFLFHVYTPYIQPLQFYTYLYFVGFNSEVYLCTPV